MEKGIKKYIYIVYLSLTILTLFLFYSLILRPQKDISEEENRTLQKIPTFTMKDFLSGDYQSQMENSISDQLLFSIQIKYGVKQVFNKITAGVSKIGDKKIQELQDQLDELALQEEIVEEETEPEEVLPKDDFDFIQMDKNLHVYKEVVANKVYKLDNSGYLMVKPHAPEEYDFNLYDPQMLEKVTYPKYLFFLMTSESADFNDLKKYRTLDYIKTQMPMDGYTQLIYHSFDEYKKMFYQTDHHWNYYGSYLGYTKIMQLLEGDDVELVQPTGTYTYDTIFEGSLARNNLLRVATQNFTVYTFDLPEYTTYVNDKQMEYGYRSWYEPDDFPHKVYTNHYGTYYGDDRAKVVFDYNQPDKESILVLGTSYTNAINELIASHYNQTHILDFRHYKNQYGKAMDVQEYMTENNLSKVIIIGDISSLGHLRK